VTSVLLWAIIGFAAWYLAAHPYERLLGSIAWDFFPQKEVFLALKDHVFSIGLTGAGDTPLPQLTLISHNFGFGLVVTGSVILGTRGRSWSLRLIGLCCAWLFLLLTQTGWLVAAAHTYLMATTQSEIPLGFSLFVKSVHPIVVILPIVIIVLCLVIPFEKSLSRLVNITPRPTSGSRRGARP
jgi:hypothetical protein